MYNQTRSFNAGLALDLGIEAALIYDDLAYAQHVFGEGFFYRSYDQLLKRLPYMSERSARNHIRSLEAAGWIVTKVKKVNGLPTLHFQIVRNLTATPAVTKGTATVAESYNDKQLKNNTSADAPTKKESLESRKMKLLSLVNRVTGRNFRVLPEKGVKKTLDAFSLVEIEQALTALAADPWHKPKLKELSLDYFIRSTTIDKFATSKTPQSSAEDHIANQDEMVRRRMEAHRGAN